MHLHLLSGVLLLLVSGIAGGINAVAGGGTLLTFPTLIWLGLPPVVANATSTVGLVPGALSGAWGYRRELREVKSWMTWLLPLSFVGGALGALLLTRTPPRLFNQLVPILVLGATVLFMSQGPISRRLRRLNESPGTPHRVAAGIGLLGITTYGGYFGAGMGILMLAVFGLLRLGNIHQSNGLKSFCGACVNGVASGLFIVKGLVLWKVALTMCAGSILGGYLAADTARKLGQNTIRWIVISIGLVATVVLALQRLL